MVKAKIGRVISATVAVLGLAVAGAGPAAPAEAITTAASLTLSPTTMTVKRGSAVALNVAVDTGGQPVNAVQVWLTFPDANLDCSSVVTSVPWQTATKFCNSSQAAFAVNTAPGSAPVVGTSTIATVNLMTTAVRGTATVAFDRSKTLVVASDTNEDILGTTSTSTIRVR